MTIGGQESVELGDELLGGCRALALGITSTLSRRADSGYTPEMPDCILAVEDRGASGSVRVQLDL